MMTSKKRGRKPLDSEAISKGREMLVAEARARFTEFGVQNVSIRKITDGVGMSPMSFYCYFPNKRAVLVHIWNDIFLDLATDCRAATANQSTPRDALLAYWFAVCRLLASQSRLLSDGLLRSGQAGTQ